MLFKVRYLVVVCCCVMFAVVCCLLLLIAWRLLFGVCWLLFVVCLFVGLFVDRRCSLAAACCSLFGVR